MTARVPISVSRGRTEPDGEIKPPNEDGRPLTESEYLAWADRRMREFAAELNERYAGLLPEGVRFEWGPVPDPPAG